MLVPEYLRLRFFYAAACVVALLPAVASAQAELIGTEFEVSTLDPLSTPTHVDVSVSPDGRFVVVWRSAASSGSDTNFSQSVQGRLYDATGTPIGDQFQVNAYTTSTQRNPVVAVGPKGAFTVVWRSFGSFGSDDDRSSIQAQRFDSSGSKIGTQFQVNSYTSGSQDLPAVATGPSGKLVVVWENPTPCDIRAQVFDAAGEPEGPELQVDAIDRRCIRHPKVAVGPVGEFVIVWTNSAERSTTIAGRRFAPNNVPIGSQLAINGSGDPSPSNPDVATNRDGAFMVAWNSGNRGDIDTSQDRVTGQVFDPNGAKIGTAFQINTYTTYSQNYPSIAAGRNGEFVVVWQSDLLDPPYKRIDAQTFDHQGRRLGTEFVVNTNRNDSGLLPDIASGLKGGFIAVWEGLDSVEPGETRERSIRAQRLSTSAGAAQCGDAIPPAEDNHLGTSLISAADALAVLQASVASFDCELCVCDTNGSGAITSTDALLVLRVAVGTAMFLNCPPCD